MFRISPKLAGVAVLLLFSILPALAQYTRQYAPIDRGAPPPPCSVGPYYYNKKGDKPPPVYDYTEKHLMKRADTGAARSALSFQPNQVKIEKGDPIIFSPEIGWPTNGRLTGDLYAIYSPAGPLKHDRYLMPVDESGLPTGSGPINAVINPLNYYFHNGSGSKPDPAPPIPSTIVRLQDRQLDTDGMPLGEYWFTVQSAIQYPDGGGTCHKTSSIVLIEIVPPPPPPLIKVNVDAQDGYCEQKTYPHATAKFTLQGIQERDVKLSWNVTHSKGGNVTWEPSGNTKSVRVTNPTPGTYTFTARAESKNDPQVWDEGSDTAEYIDCIPGKVEAAGLVYFRFAVPYPKPSPTPDPSAPETWSGGRYPREYFGYSKRLDFENERAVETNTEALERIIARLEADTSLYLRIYGFADFKRTECYDNWALGERRAEMVYNYIVSRLGEDIKSRLSMDVTQTMGDGSVSTHEDDDQADRRLWDRRVEIYYTTDPVLLNPGKRPVQSCPATRKGKKPRRR